MPEAHLPESPAVHRNLTSSRLAWQGMSLLMFLMAGGCASYQVGSQSLFSPDVSTVYVPMIESDTLRRNLGERLTEAVIKEIEKQTPYKVVDAGSADSILSAKIRRMTKRRTVNNGFDDPRDNQVKFTVIVSWVDRRGDIIRREQELPIDPQSARIVETGDFIPEFGQSVSTAQQTAIQRIAEQIVAMMETPW